MITGIDRNERKPFSVVGDAGTPKTVFWIGNLTQRDKISIFGDTVNKEGKVDPMVIQAKSIEIFTKGVKKIDNLTSEGSVIEKIDEEVIESIPFDVLMEVVAKVMEINFTSEIERKN